MESNFNFDVEPTGHNNIVTFPFSTVSVPWKFVNGPQLLIIKIILSPQAIYLTSASELYPRLISFRVLGEGGGGV
jgi:hypothetical protein